MRNFLAVVLLFGVSLLPGCASEPRRFDPDLCNKNAAYETGYNDGRWGYKEMDSAFLNRCREDLRDQAQAGYKDGFDKAHKEFLEQKKKEDAAAAAPAYSPGPYQQNAPNVNINIGGSQSIGGQGHGYSRAWYCTAEAFMKKFEAFGPTQIEARRAAIAQCTRQYNQMHCNDVQCQPNN